MISVEHSRKYETVLRYYRTGMWSEKRVRDAVAKEWITKEEYLEITGETYE